MTVLNFATSTVSQKQSNGNVSWDVFNIVLFGVGSFVNVIKGCDILYIGVGLSALLVSTYRAMRRPKTVERVTEWLHVFFVYVIIE